MSESFALKHRPQKIKDLDLTQVREGLLKLVKSAKVPHALLFTGPRGTGKTSAARIVAKVVNCLNRKKSDPEPCNRCSACKQITAGTSLDVIEIDAASTRGIDDIRQLREKIKLAPSQLKNKVYIIDEVHMLTTEAFNALLKILEEPPKNTYFVLCTTDPAKLPETIVSRCTRFNFHKAKIAEVVDSLKRVKQKEKLKIEKGVLQEIAKSVDGSFRDGHKILDQLAVGRKKLTLKEAKALLGRLESLSPKKLLTLVAKRDLKTSLLEIDRIVEQGADLTVYCLQLLETLRRGLLFQAGLKDLSQPKETTELSLEEIKLLLALFSQAANQIKTNPIPQLPLELTVVEWCTDEEGQTQTGDDQEGHKVSLSGGQSSRSSRDKAKGRQTIDPYSSKKPLAPASRSGGLGEIEKKWQEFLASIKPMNHSVEALLRASRPVGIDGDVLTLEVFYKFHKERLEEEKCRGIFEEVFADVFGWPIKLKCVLGERKPTVVTTSPPQETKKEPRDTLEVAEEIFGS
jgi:DNA polymerase-3 subunit gamma/tau